MKNLFKNAYPVLLLLFLTAGCIREDLPECIPAVTQLSFAYTTPCRDTAVYPADIDSLHLYVFNADGLFTGEHIFSAIRLDEVYFCNVSLPAGTHRIVTWAGTGHTCQTIPGSFVKGTTTLDQALLCLHKGYSASTGHTDSVLVCTGSLYFASDMVEAGATHLVDLTKNTTGIRVSVFGLAPKDTCRLVITGDDKHYKFDNTFTSSGKLNYTKPLNADDEGNAQAAVDMLNPGTGKNHPEITILDDTTGKEIFRKDLLKLITDRIPKVNFHCVHEFDIDITFNTDLSVTISVNGWSVTEEEGNLG